ncbi:hypothetical protein BYT27DRAFT_7259192 [Phlegmacium glaucopus]|nr:hypothetical protein BYT27DRAFT_7259192 [Phlegmacium glaucopus]
MTHGSTTEPESPFAAEPIVHDPTGSGYADSIAMVDQSTDSPPENERIKLISELDSSVEQFQTGLISKTKAISTILRILGENTHVTSDESQKEKMFKSYLAEILSFQHSINGPNPDLTRTQSTRTDVIPKGREDQVHKSRERDENESGDNVEEQPSK